MGRRSAVLVLTFAALAAGWASSAGARAPGKWTQITDSIPSTLGEVSLARTGDGVLHVAWVRPTPAHPGSKNDLLNRSISAAGAIGAARTVAGGWSTIENPALVATGGDGLGLFAGAIRSLSHTETVSNLAFFQSADGGTSWSAPVDVTKTGAAYSAPVSAALGDDGTPFESWGTSECLCVHRGTLASTPNADFQAGLGHYGYDPGMAVDPTSHEPAVAWFSNGTGHTGVWEATIDQVTGARSGPPVRMPGTSNLHDGPFNGRTPIVGRPGGGLFVAYEGGYPTHSKVLLWRVGAASSTVVAHNGSGVSSVGLAASPTGRLWVFWSTRSSSDTPLIHARRSNRDGTILGTTETIQPPRHANTSWNLVGSGQAGRLDLAGSFTLGTSSHAATWYTQILPGLALKAAPKHLQARTKHAQPITFTVSDAGSPVSGARVSVGHVTGLTNGRGKVTLALGPFRHRGHVTAHATANDYGAARLRVKVR